MTGKNTLTAGLSWVKDILNLQSYYGYSTGYISNSPVILFGGIKL